MRKAWQLYRRFGARIATRLSRHFGVIHNIVGTDVPNVPCLRVVKMTMVNSYGQTREWPRKPEKEAA